ncbi:MFS transporter, UMF1 family [Cognatiyoonia sediminum]|uniref:MFS transporter, UMF1 family n=1 Tax=Cognatiyoonia sediminum TaxID=1508389 RepID=A0A1M5Q3S9_9RHOB|nr:MFS transporter [Cognatiyoonia sediminum]SHH08471.1 MFS transporter, UMF1 family [Cognatiyoonia sediminum]
MAAVSKKRIWGWMTFDWATQPYYTLGLTFIFGPYFAVVATDYYLSQGLADAEARAQAQSIWAGGQTVAGLVIAFTAPFLGAFADNTGRKRPWIALFSVIYVIGAAALWYMKPDTSSLFLFLFIFYIGFIAAESALNFVNAYLPSMGDDDEVGKVSGSGAAFGYWGGLVSVIIMLAFFAESGDTGKTIAGLSPVFGLDPDQREGTRAVGPFIAIWYVLFIIPFFMWVKDDPEDAGEVPKMSKVISDLVTTLKRVGQHKSTASFLIGGMFYRDALNALYAFGGVYATLVLGWTVAELGPFAIASIIAAAVFTFVGGRFDARVGPKPVIKVCIYFLIFVCVVTVSLSRESLFGIPLPEGSNIPDIIFFIIGCMIGGAGGALYAASRSLMVRHGHPDRPTETFGLFALSGKATAFLAPLLISVFTAATGNVQLGYLPLIFLFLLGLILLRWVNKDGDRAEWAASQQ